MLSLADIKFGEILFDQINSKIISGTVVLHNDQIVDFINLHVYHSSSKSYMYIKEWKLWNIHAPNLTHT